jgi:hypothetical protein
LPLAIFEIFHEKGIGGHSLLNHKGGRMEVFGLEAAQFLERPMESTLRGGAGAINRDLEAIERFFVDVLRRSGFERGAAAQTPRGLDDFTGEGLFERRDGREFGQVAALELIKDVLFFGADEVGDRKKSEFDGVLGNAGFTFGRDGADGPFGILPIGQDLGGAAHVGYPARA